MTSTPSPAPEGEMKLRHYYVSGVVVTSANPAYFQIMEEVDGVQTCIATVPFNNHLNHVQGREPARRDADTIVRALNAPASPTPVAEGDKELVRYLRWLAKVTEDDARNMLGRAADRLEQLSGK